MRRSQNYHFRPAFLGDCGTSSVSSVIDTQGYVECVWLINFDCASGPDDTVTDSITGLLITGSDNSDGTTGAETLYSAGGTKVTSGATSTLPGDKDMRVISIRLDPSLPKRRYQRLTMACNQASSSSVKMFAVCALQHNGQYAMTNELCAGTNGEAVIGRVPTTPGGTFVQ